MAVLHKFKRLSGLMRIIGHRILKNGYGVHFVIPLVSSHQAIHSWLL